MTCSPRSSRPFSALPGLLGAAALLALLAPVPAPAQPSYTKTIVTREAAQKAVAAPQADNSPQAVERDRQDAEAGKAEGQYALGARCLEGRGLPRDYGQARLWLGRAAEQAEPRAQHWLGVMHRQGLGGPRNLPEAGRLLLLAANQGNGPAQFQLAEMYATGQLGPVDSDAALQWYRASGSQGDREALFRAAMLLLSGEGVRQGDQEACDLLALSARRGHAKALHNLAVLQAQGRGTSRDMAQAARNERLAAGLGVAEAQFAYGLLLLRGEGVLQDHAEGLRQLRHAAAGGHARARAVLAQVEAGDQAEKHLPQATRELKATALAGDSKARLHLGTLYATGAGGLRKDPPQAYLWLDLAAQGGEAMAAVHRDALNLKPAELERARAQVRALAPQTVQ